MKDGKNAADPITGQVMETQAGENFNVIGNTFIGKMKEMRFILEVIITSNIKTFYSGKSI